VDGPTKTFFFKLLPHLQVLGINIARFVFGYNQMKLECSLTTVCNIKKGYYKELFAEFLLKI
jgi:hypothetical protein